MRLTLLLFLLALAGCGSPPTHYYVLTALPPQQTARACTGGPLAVARVLLPDTLDRQSVVRELGPDRLEISSQDRWAAPLDTSMRRVLAEDLRQRLAPRLVLMPGDPAPAGGLAQIDVAAQRFAAGTGGGVTLQADWTLRDRQGRAVLTRSETVQVPASGADVAAPMSQALATLADRIATAVCTG